MALQKIDDRWWSDIVRTEIRLSRKGPRSLWILPPYPTQTNAPRAGLLKTITDYILLKAAALVGRRPEGTSIHECADQAEAYLHACLAAPFFCYVSPAIYGVPPRTTCDEPGVEQNTSRAGEDI